jgi:hypothetical protein
MNVSPKQEDGDNPIVAFYSRRAPDSSGRHLEQILAWDDASLEQVHDYIQWLFPLREPSRFNPDAPLLNDTVVASFHADPGLRANLLKSFHRMLEFYGLAATQTGDGGTKIIPGPRFQERAAEWLRPGDHNHLRITRILTCLRLLGCDVHSLAFFVCLSGIHRDLPGAITPATFAFWESAARPRL